VEGVQLRVSNAIGSLIDRALAAGRSLLNLIGLGGPQPGVQTGGGPVADDRLPEVEFDVDDDDHEHHRIWWQEEAGRKRLVMSSHTTRKMREVLTIARQRVVRFTGGERTRRTNLLDRADAAVVDVERLDDVLANKRTTGDARVQARSALLAAEGLLANLVKSIIKGTSLRKGRERYRLEGMVGTYSQLNSIGGTGDRFEADHQPAADVLVRAAGLTANDGHALFPPTSQLRRFYTAGAHSSGGLTIILGELRHALGRTYGMSAAGAEAEMVGEVRKAIGGRADQRLAVKRVLRLEAGRDSRAMLSVITRPYSHAETWQDVWALNLKTDKDVQDLAGEIRESVRAGEARINLQTFDDIDSTA
jgi:hypothetical protein